MGKHSSDSDSDRRTNKIYKGRSSRRRSSSSSSSGSRRRRRKDKRRSKSRSREPRERYSKSRRSRSLSSSKSKSRRRSPSRDHSRYKERRRRSRSRPRHRSNRSRSKSYIREYSSKAKVKRTPSTSSSSSTSSESSSVKIKPNIKLEEGTVEIKLQSEGVGRNTPDLNKIDVKVLDEINDDSFAPKQFTSSKSKKVLDNIVIDLKKQTIKIPEVEPTEIDSIFHHNLFLNEEARMEKWVKELYGYRQKALQQGLKPAH